MVDLEAGFSGIKVDCECLDEVDDAGDAGNLEEANMAQTSERVI